MAVETAPVTSEALQSTVRRLLPSQQGFGSDLEATNLIQPVIDLTPTAEGSQLPSYLQKALSQQSSTGFAVANTTTVLINTPGFYILRGQIQVDGSSTGTIRMGTSASKSNIIAIYGSIQGAGSRIFDTIVFLDTGDEIDAVSSSGTADISGVHFQIADRYGNLNNPGGFTFE
jgi:hypothetical protein